MSFEWIMTGVVVVLVVLYVLVRIFMDEPAKGQYTTPDLPNEDREAAFEDAVAEDSIDSLGDEPIDELDGTEGGADDDDVMNIDDLPDLS